jgi:hypothetical protein
MTQWVEDPSGGRDRGPGALVRAWGEVLVRPRRFFRTGVAPGDQGPGLTFAAAVVLVEEATRFALVPDAFPVVAGQHLLSAVLWLAVAVVLVMPAALHLVAALETLVLVAMAAVSDAATDRGGVGETVQVLAYSAAPCALAGGPVAPLRVACAAYGTVLLVLGLREVHGLSLPASVVAAVVPAAVVFGYGFRGFAALGALV